MRPGRLRDGATRWRPAAPRHEPLAPVLPSRRLFQPASLASIAIVFWMTGPVAPFIPNLDNTFNEMMTLNGGVVPAPIEGNEDLLRLSWIPVYFAALVLAGLQGRAILRVLRQQQALLLLLCWTVLSIFWSVSPDDTMRRSIALVASAIFGLYLGSRFDPLWTVRLLAMALGVDAIASLACGLAFPAIGVASDGDYAGAWRGVFVSKNSLGATMLIACLAYYVLYLIDRKLWQLLAIGLALGLLALSQSRTPLVILVALVPTLALTRRFFRNPRQFGLVLGLALCSAGLATLSAGIMLRPLLHLLGRDTTLSGRTDIWLLSWNAIYSHFWFGYGFGAFWSNPWGPANEIWDALNWRAPSSHSGVLELWLALGAVGVVMFAWLVGQTFLRITAGAARRRYEETLWLIGYFMIFVMHAVTEPSMMEQTSITWVLLVAISCPIASRSARGSPVPHAIGPVRAAVAGRTVSLAAGHWPSRHTSRE